MLCEAVCYSCLEDNDQGTDWALRQCLSPVSVILGLGLWFPPQNYTNTEAIS